MSNTFLPLVQVLTTPKQSYKSGEYYDSKSAGICTNGFATQAVVTGTFYASPFFIDDTHVFDKIGIAKTAGTGTGITARIGIYSDADNRPGDLVLDAGEIANFDLNQGYELDTNINLIRNKYWTVLLISGNRTVRAHGSVEGRSVGVTTLGDVTLDMCVTGSQAYGAMPASAPACVLSVINPIRFFLRAA